jgi:ABC-type transport system involved in cytochrome bd biosynthesis fused ATPase/permease subunit
VLLGNLTDAGLAELLVPDGLRTRVGDWLTRHRPLSPGQWQKLAFARLLGERDRDLWVLDEPTAHLDPESAARVFEVLTQAKHATRLVITHRIENAMIAQRVIFLEGGRILRDVPTSEVDWNAVRSAPRQWLRPTGL